MQELLLLVEEGIIKLPFTFPYVPWTIVRGLNYVRQIKNVFERVQFDHDPDSATPLHHIWLSPKRVDAWFKMRQEDARRNL